MSETPAAPINNKIYVIKSEDGETQGGADELPNACVFAAAIFTAAISLGYRPSISVVEQATGNVAAIIGVPQEGWV